MRHAQTAKELEESLADAVSDSGECEYDGGDRKPGPGVESRYNSDDSAESPSVSGSCPSSIPSSTMSSG